MRRFSKLKQVPKLKNSEILGICSPIIGWTLALSIFWVKIKTIVASF